MVERAETLMPDRDPLLLRQYAVPGLCANPARTWLA
jgi:hypothetical protein